MTRPALVIGLGGTGQWIVTYLKRELLDGNGGTFPDGVALRVFDTLQDPSAFVGAKKDASARVGSVMLEEGIEYIWYGDNIRPMVDNIFSDNEDAYSCQRWLKKSIPNFPTYPNNVFHVNVGAAALRQVGRLAFIKDIQTGDGSKIKNAIDNAIETITKTRTIQGRIQGVPESDYSHVLEVIFIGSLAGGTGAGIMLDTALWCRKWLDPQFPGAVTYRAFFVTPQTYTEPGAAQNTEMLARSFAAWREVNRFQTANGKVGSGEVCYDSTNPQMRITTDQRLFDATYIIDPRRQYNPIPNNDVDRKTQNLFPSIAQAIAAILDDNAGSKFTEQAINLVTTIAGHPTAHNAIGTFCYSVPIYHQLEEYSFQLQQKVMDRFLMPELQQDRCVGLLSDQNREVGAAFFGRAAVAQDLQKNDYAGKVPNSGFWKQVGNASINNWVDNAVIQTAHANNFPKDGNIGTHCNSGILDKIQGDPKGVAAIAQYNAREKNRSMVDWVPESQKRGPGFTPCKGRTVIPGECDTNITNRYEKDKGTFITDILEPAIDVQVSLFANYLQALLEGYLNGADSDQSIAKMGKLGWVEKYLEGFEKVLQDYINYCTNVLDKAGGVDVHDKLQRSIQTARQAYDADGCKTTIFNVFDERVHPKAYKVERDYIGAREKEAYFKKEQAIFLAHIAACTKAKEIVQATAAELKTWKDALALGWPTNNNQQDNWVDGLYNELVKDHAAVKANAASDQSMNVVNKNIGERDYVISEAEIENQLRALTWSVVVDGRRGDNNTIVEPKTVVFSLAWGGEALDNTIWMGTSSKNLEITQKRGRTAYRGVLLANPNYSVDAELQHLFNNDPVSLGNSLVRIAEPWFKPVVGRGGPLFQPGQEGILAVSGGEIVQGQNPQLIFSQVVDRVNARTGDGTQYSLVNRADKFKLTLVRYANVIKSEDFQAYEDSKQAYISMHLNPPPNTPPEHRNLEYFHIYPEEVNAAIYERKIKETLNLNFNPLNAETVLLLADDQKIELFFRAVALGIVRVSPVLNSIGVPGLAWICQANENSPVIHLTDVINGYGVNFATNYHELITQFAYKGQDVRQDRANRVGLTTIDAEIQRNEIKDRESINYREIYNLPQQPDSRGKLVNDHMKMIDDDLAALANDPRAQLPKRTYPILADLAIQKETDLCRLGETILRIASHDPVNPRNQEAIL